MRIAFYLSLLLLLTACREKSADQKGYFLEMNLAKGDRFLMTLQMEQDLESEMNGEPAFVEQFFNFDILTEIDSTQEGNHFTTLNRYQRIQMQQQISMETDTIMYYLDTDEPESAYLPSSSLLNYYLKLIELPYKSVIDRMGNVISTDLHEVNVAAGGKQYSSPYQHLFTYGVIYPGFRLEEKDTWEKEVSYRDSTVSIEGMLNYTLEVCDGEKALINMTGRFKSTGKGLDAASKMELEQSGQIWVYMDSGWIKDAEITQTIRYTQPESNTDERVVSSRIFLKGTPLK